MKSNSRFGGFWTVRVIKSEAAHQVCLFKNGKASTLISSHGDAVAAVNKARPELCPSRLITDIPAHDRRVESWWDNSSKNWITQVKELATGFQVGDADIDGQKYSMETAHLWAVARILESAE